MKAAGRFIENGVGLFLGGDAGILRSAGPGANSSTQEGCGLIDELQGAVGEFLLG